VGACEDTNALVGPRATDEGVLFSTLELGHAALPQRGRAGHFL